MLCLLVDFIVGYIENIFKQIFKRLSKNRQSSSMTLYNNNKKTEPFAWITWMCLCLCLCEHNMQPPLEQRETLTYKLHHCSQVKPITQSSVLFQSYTWQNQSTLHALTSDEDSRPVWWPSWLVCWLRAANASLLASPCVDTWSRTEASASVIPLGLSSDRTAAHLAPPLYFLLWPFFPCVISLND